MSRRSRQVHIGEAVALGAGGRRSDHIFDYAELRCSDETAPEIMLRAIEEAKLSIFFLSQEFAEGKWPMEELRSFLRRNEDSLVEEKPLLLRNLYRLSVKEASTCGVYFEQSAHFSYF